MSSSRVLLRAAGVSKSYPVEDEVPPGLVAKLARRFRSGTAVEVLRGVDLEIRAGESVGILGRNGAGKTTLLSILGGIVEPTSGAVERFGSVAAILGAGERLQTDLTGVQNAELFCDTLGLDPTARARAVTAIERFAELGDYFRRPLRTYSSGMRARLGFSCAANVEAELIIVDEVLAVGDLEFRQKCLSFIERQQQRGVTYLLVSHSAGAIANMCTRALVLDRGEKLFDGSATDGLGYYRRMLKAARLARALADPEGTGPQAPIGAGGAPEPAADPIEVVSFEHHVPPDGGLRSAFSLRIRANAPIRRPDIRVAISDDKGIGIAGFRTKLDGPQIPDLQAGAEVALRVSYANRLTPGRYFYRLGLASSGDEGERLMHYSDVAGHFDVDGPTRIGLVDLEMRPESVRVSDPDRGHSGRLVAFMHLPGDIEALGPIVAAAAESGDFEPLVMVHSGLYERAPNAPEILSRLGAALVEAEPDAVPAALVAQRGPATWIFGCESSLRPHRPAHELATAARAAGQLTATVQHGFENVGLSFFDDVHGEGVTFASELVLGWSSPDRYPAQTPAATRAKIRPIGRPRLEPQEPAAWPQGAPDPDVAIFENIHWHRYSDSYRRRFLDDVAALCRARPGLQVLVRPHPQGRWLTDRFEGERPSAANLTIADPQAPEWRGVSARETVRRAGVVVTTPSTVALDAAEEGACVAVLAYDLEPDLYAPLVLVRGLEDLLGLVDSGDARAAARDAAGRFVKRMVAAGPAAENALQALRGALADRARASKVAGEPIAALAMAASDP